MQGSWGTSARVMVTGATGRLGCRVVRSLARSLPGDRLLAAASHPARLPGGQPVAGIDLRDRDAVVACVRAYRPDVVIHLAALASPERCAVEPGLAHDLNVQGTRAVREAADEVGAHLVHASTDFVFDGEAGGYREGDEPRPLTAYGRTKRLAELALDAGGACYLVVRLPLMFGRSLTSVPSAFDGQVEALRHRRGRGLVAFADEYRTPVSLGQAAGVLVDLAARRYAGLVHVAGAERVSRLGLVQAYARRLGVEATEVEVASRLSMPGEPRPRDLSLRAERLAADLPHLVPPPLADQVAAELAT